MSSCFVFLTHRLDQFERPAVHEYFDDLMFSVEPVFGRLGAFSGFRRFLKCRRICYDSGGFKFLIKGVLDVDPREVALYYKALGFNDCDFLIQLDLPPSYYMSKSERLRLIEKSAAYYHVMADVLKSSNLLGVVHGWAEDELLYSLSLLEDPGVVAAGSFVSPPVYAHDYIQKSRIALGSYIAKSVLKEKIKSVPRRAVFERLVVAMNLLRDREVFMLGGSNANTLHIMFLLGARYSDGAAWRLATKLYCIMIPELGRFSIGVKAISKRLNDQALKTLKEYHSESPFSFLSFNDFIVQLRNDFITRALWNAWVLKVEEQIANEYACDPDRYYEYLRERWANNSYWRTILNFVWKRMKHPYIQPKLDIFLKTHLKVKKSAEKA